MSVTVTDEFEFRLGELVFFRGASHFAGQRPRQFVVTEQVLQVCHGGQQCCYRLCSLDAIVPEIALSRDEPPYRPKTADALADEARLQAALTESRLQGARTWAGVEPIDET